MVIAAKALQQKLVDELAQVETAIATVPKLDLPAAAVTVTAAAAAPVGDMSECSTDAEQQLGIAVIGMPVGSTTAAMEGLPSAASTGAVISPFAARSVCAFGQSSFSVGPSEPTSAAASAAAVTPIVGTPAGSLSAQGAAELSPAAAAAVAAATAAAAAVEVSPTGTDHTEHSFTDNVQPQSAGAAAASAGAANGVHVKGSSSNHSSFSGFALAQRGSSAAPAAASSNDAGGWQQRDNASVSDAGLSSSTIAPSNAAVAGSAPGSVSYGQISRDGSSHKPPQSMLMSSTGQLVAAVQASSTTRSVQWAHLQDSNASSSQHQQQEGRHRRVPSAAAAGVYSRQGSRGLSDTAAGVRGSDDQQPSRFPWGRMESLKRRNSKK
jgi:hypothetical protein